ncbi:V-type ATP synthase subunit I [Proteiniclasticum ruminis]|uniref:V/A-type H+-transporting ATPase subunit I n=1 Tax=Proteiniclasticum ruminis TaxID=398199 RepID=A0A1I4ZTK0_9CLOT|nr:V-type ATP synthase subunit I [Proteiniclasticum ruminis]SFN53574.1 V/A-type H+-transporting ATPase subunit I [Proteiniclasticum ruminis]
MAIVKMSNFGLFTFDSDREKLLHELQKFGYVHFTDLKEQSAYLEEGLETLEIPYEVSEVEERIQSVKFAMDLLKRYDDRETGMKAMIKGKNSFTFEELEKKVAQFDYEPVIDKFRELTRKIDLISQEELKEKAAMEELRPWRNLNYDVRLFRDFQFSEVFTGTIPKKLMEPLKEALGTLEETYLETLSEGKDEAYVVGLTSKREKEDFNEILRNHSFTTVNLSVSGTPEEDMKKRKESLEKMKEEKKKLQAEIKSMAGHLARFEEVYEYLLNLRLRYQAENNFLRTGSVNVIEGYIPTDKTDAFRKAVEKTQEGAYYLELAEAKKEDVSVPILLKNGKFAEAFESLTTMYSLPTYDGIDPTPLFAPFFFAFFGMMIGDWGYGIILMVLTGVALKIANLEKGQRLMMRFLFYLSFSTIAWGLMFGTFFGAAFPGFALINPSTEYQKLLIVSIAFGGIHLFYALGIKAYLAIRDGKPLDALYDVGFWYMALMGAIVFLLTMVLGNLPEVLGTVSLVVMVIGMVGIILTGGRENETAVGKLAGGMYSLYGISGYIGDFVSYSRLMALGLSGGFIATAINMMVGMLFDMGIPGMIAGVIVFLGGQAFNLFLSALSAYVHTSRLTYVEFFGKFYDGGGKPFKLFRNKSKYINVE